MHRAPILRVTRAIALLTLLAALVGCETTVDDVKKWEKAKGAQDKMKEFLLGDNAIDVKTEAVMVLVRRGEASSLMAILPEVQDDQRVKILDNVIEQLDTLIVDESQDLAIKAKDAAFYLAQTNPPEAQRDRLRGILVRWVDGDNFWRPLEVVGAIDRMRIFEEVGIEGLPVLERVLLERFAKLDEAKTDEFKLKWMQDLQMVVALAQSLNLAETDAMIARVFVARMEQRFPDLPEVYGIPFLKNKSPELKAMAKRIMLDPDYRSGELNTLRDLITNEYYVNVQTKEGIAVCATVIREDRSGFLRWMCARTLLKVAREAGVDHVLIGLPDDPTALRMPADHPLAGAYNLDAYYWEEGEAFCRSIKPLLDGKVPLDTLREHLASERPVQKLMAITCLSYHGTDDDMARLRELAVDKTDISAWGTVPTLGEYAVAAADAHAERVKQVQDEGAASAPATE